MTTPAPVNAASQRRSAPPTATDATNATGPAGTNFTYTRGYEPESESSRRVRDSKNPAANHLILDRKTFAAFAAGTSATA